MTKLIVILMTLGLVACSAAEVKKVEQDVVPAVKTAIEIAAEACKGVDKLPDGTDKQKAVEVCAHITQASGAADSLLQVKQ